MGYYNEPWLISRLPGFANYALDMNPTWLRHEASCDPIPPDVFYHSCISRVTKNKKKYLTFNLTIKEELNEIIKIVRIVKSFNKSMLGKKKITKQE